jgi:UDPglucose 6-dehydrogenase
LKNRPKISIIGAGYVGLCTAVGFSSKGYNVTACEVDRAKARKINQGIPPFHEPGLEEKLKASVKNGNLKCVVNQTEKAVIESDLTFVTVGTPSTNDGSIDLKYVESAAHDIGKALKKKTDYHITIITSTVIPGTTQNTVKPILEGGVTQILQGKFRLMYETRISASRLRVPRHPKR